LRQRCHPRRVPAAGEAPASAQTTPLEDQC
jgi:hypothetical protein